MIPITATTPILLAVQPTDFRKQIDGLVAHCRQVLDADPQSGTFFIFINRAKTMIRVLVFETTGYWVMTKRLSNGKFSGWPSSDRSVSPLSARELMQILRTHREVDEDHRQKRQIPA